MPKKKKFSVSRMSSSDEAKLTERITLHYEYMFERRKETGIALFASTSYKRYGWGQIDDELRRLENAEKKRGMLLYYKEQYPLQDFEKFADPELKEYENKALWYREKFKPAVPYKTIAQLIGKPEKNLPKIVHDANQKRDKAIRKRLGIGGVKA